MVSLGTNSVAVMQLNESDEMGRVERGVPSSRPGHQSCALYAQTPLVAGRKKHAHYRKQVNRRIKKQDQTFNFVFGYCTSIDSIRKLVIILPSTQNNLRK